MRRCRTTRPGPAAVAVFAFALASCGVESSAVGDDADAAPHLPVAEDLRVGSVDDPVVGFSRIGSVAVGPDGRIYVVEAQDPHVRVLDESGARVGTIGGPGEGPGEFAQPRRIGIRADTLWVHDSRRRRIYLYSSAGDLLEEFAAPGLSSNFAPGVIAFPVIELVGDGSVRATPDFGTILGRRGDGSSSFPDSVRVPILRLDRGGEVVDTLDEMTMHVAYPSDTGGMPQADVIRDPWPHADGPIVRWFEGGKVLVDHSTEPQDGPSTFTITRVGVSEDTTWRRTFSYTPRRTDQDAVREWLPVGDDFVGPDVLPGVTDVEVDAHGGVWLRRGIGGGDMQTWLVLDAAGDLRGRVELPVSAEIRLILTDEIYAVERDDFEVPWLVRYRIG